MISPIGRNESEVKAIQQGAMAAKDKSIARWNSRSTRIQAKRISVFDAVSIPVTSFNYRTHLWHKRQFDAR
jgi:hypothetical protein